MIVTDERLPDDLEPFGLVSSQSFGAMVDKSVSISLEKFQQFW